MLVGKLGFDSGFGIYRKGKFFGRSGIFIRDFRRERHGRNAGLRKRDNAGFRVDDSVVARGPDDRRAACAGRRKRKRAGFLDRCFGIQFQCRAVSRHDACRTGFHDNRRREHIGLAGRRCDRIGKITGVEVCGNGKGARGRALDVMIIAVADLSGKIVFFGQILPLERKLRIGLVIIRLCAENRDFGFDRKADGNRAVDFASGNLRNGKYRAGRAVSTVRRFSLDNGLAGRKHTGDHRSVVFLRFLRCDKLDDVFAAFERPDDGRFFVHVFIGNRKRCRRMLITGIYVENHVRKQNFRVFFDGCAAAFPSKHRIAAVDTGRIGGKSVSESGKKRVGFGNCAAAGRFTRTGPDGGFRVMAVGKACGAIQKSGKLTGRRAVHFADIVAVGSRDIVLELTADTARAAGAGHRAGIVARGDFGIFGIADDTACHRVFRTIFRLNACAVDTAGDDDGRFLIRLVAVHIADDAADVGFGFRRGHTARKRAVDDTSGIYLADDAADIVVGSCDRAFYLQVFNGGRDGFSVHGRKADPAEQALVGGRGVVNV